MKEIAQYVIPLVSVLVSILMASKARKREALRSIGVVSKSVWTFLAKWAAWIEVAMLALFILVVPWPMSRESFGLALVCAFSCFHQFFIKGRDELFVKIVNMLKAQVDAQESLSDLVSAVSKISLVTLEMTTPWTQVLPVTEELKAKLKQMGDEIASGYAKVLERQQSKTPPE